MSLREGGRRYENFISDLDVHGPARNGRKFIHKGRFVAGEGKKTALDQGEEVMRVHGRGGAAVTGKLLSEEA